MMAAARLALAVAALDATALAAYVLSEARHALPR